MHTKDRYYIFSSYIFKKETEFHTVHSSRFLHCITVCVLLHPAPTPTTDAARLCNTRKE